jgi:hypothetical protein
MVKPNAEQTCSLFSSLTYGYLDSLIFLAYKQGGLSFDQLPALADYDSAEHLIRKSFPVLDPHSDGTSKHLLYGFLRVYRSCHAMIYDQNLNDCRPRIHIAHCAQPRQCQFILQDQAFL